MSKGLEALERIKENCDLFDEGYQWDTTFSELFDEDISIIEKELKALEIIKENIIFCKNVESIVFKSMSKEEYDLLKEVLK